MQLNLTFLNILAPLLVPGKNKLKCTLLISNDWPGYAVNPPEQYVKANITTWKPPANQVDVQIQVPCMRGHENSCMAGRKKNVPMNTTFDLLPGDLNGVEGVGWKSALSVKVTDLNMTSGWMAVANVSQKLVTWNGNEDGNCSFTRHGNRTSPMHYVTCQFECFGLMYPKF